MDEQQSLKEREEAKSRGRKARRSYTETEERLLLAIVLPLKLDPDAYEAMAERLNRPIGGIVSKRNELIREQRRQLAQTNSGAVGKAPESPLPVKHHHGAMLDDMRALTAAVLGDDGIFDHFASLTITVAKLESRLAVLEVDGLKEVEEQKEPEEDRLDPWRRK